MKPIFTRRITLNFRFILAGILGLATIITDTHFSIFHQIRTYMDTIISPLYFITHVPGEFLDFISQTLLSRYQLILENRALRKELLQKNSELLLLGRYKQENIQLRELLDSPVQKNEKKIVTQVIGTINNLYTNQIVIDKGSLHDVYEGQPVISDKGIIGQVIAVAKFTSRVLLICDITHAIPTQVLRNDIRAIATGNGCKDDLKLEHLPPNTDIQVGDILVSSGLGGRFPEGYPVAVVSSVKLDKNRACIVIQAKPTASLQHFRYLLLWKGRGEGIHPMTPEEVHLLATKRLMKIFQKDTLKRSSQVKTSCKRLTSPSSSPDQENQVSLISSSGRP